MTDDELEVVQRCRRVGRAVLAFAAERDQLEPPREFFELPSDPSLSREDLDKAWHRDLRILRQWDDETRSQWDVELGPQARVLLQDLEALGFNPASASLSSWVTNTGLMRQIGQYLLATAERLSPTA